MEGVVVSEVNNIVIIVQKESGMMFPFHVDGFYLANGSKSGIRKQYKNALILFRDGKTKEISDVMINGALGSSFWGRLFSFFNSVWSVDVLTRTLSMELTEQKEIVINGLIADQNRPEPFFNLEEDVNNVAMRVRNAGSMSDVFTYLGINEDLDVLDVL
ncbi:hypothetical protein EFU27_11515 [Vibrio cholerae]|nr:hypothetical protein [Vibrio cholerae]